MADAPRRAHDRHDLRVIASGEVKLYLPMAIRQLSTGGALIELAVPLQLESLHDFRLTLGDRSVVVKGRVVHAHVDTVSSSRVSYHAGVEFVDVSAPVAKAIDDYLATVPPASVPR
jgi:hypothetical protein